MELNHGIITDFSVTRSGDIHVALDEELFNEIRYNEWKTIILFPNTNTLTKLLPYWYPGCDEYDDDDDFDHYSFDWLKRVFITCVENTKPLQTIHHIYLFIKSVEFEYSGEIYEDEWDMHNCVDIGDEGWEDYYCVVIRTSLTPTSSLMV